MRAIIFLRKLSRRINQLRREMYFGEQSCTPFASSVEHSQDREAPCSVAYGTNYLSKPKVGPRCLALVSGLREFLQRANGFTGFGTSGVIRAHIGATNHALLINDVSSGHGQAEG